MKIAVCTDISQFHRDRLRDRQWSRQFLGSAWITSLYEQEATLGIEVASGDIALQRVRAGEWRAAEVRVVQEMDAPHGRELCKLGAVPAVLTMLESPLVAYRSVDRLRRARVPFAHCLGPGALFASVPAQRAARHWPLTFPSYWRAEVPPPRPWSSREHAVLIAANKYWRERKWARVHSLKDALRVLRHGLRQRLSPTYRACRGLQLHDDRLELLHLLALNAQVAIFGRGWETLGNLPPREERRFATFPTLFRGPCAQKHEVLSGYKFTIAYENTRYPGYVTEKPIDALVASSLPVYLGAPDITAQLPAASFIDARHFPSPAALARHLEELPEAEARAMIAAGQEFLRSPLGQRHSYEGFAAWIVALAREPAAAACPA